MLVMLRICVFTWEFLAQRRKWCHIDCVRFARNITVKKDGWCLKKCIFLQNEGREKSVYLCASSLVSEPSGAHHIFGETGSLVNIWLLQNAIAFGGIKVQIVPYHSVSKHILGAHPFGRFFQCPPYSVSIKGDPMGLISTGLENVYQIERQNKWQRECQELCQTDCQMECLNICEMKCEVQIEC